METVNILLMQMHSNMKIRETHITKEIEII